MPFLARWAALCSQRNGHLFWTPNVVAGSIASFWWAATPGRALWLLAAGAAAGHVFRSMIAPAVGQLKSRALIAYTPWPGLLHRRGCRAAPRLRGAQFSYDSAVRGSHFCSTQCDDTLRDRGASIADRRGRRLCGHHGQAGSQEWSQGCPPFRYPPPANSRSREPVGSTLSPEQKTDGTARGPKAAFLYFALIWLGSCAARLAYNTADG
jgi:hypothetical protein